MFVVTPAQTQAACLAQQAAQAQRRRALAIWQEHVDQLRRIQPRTDEERLAQAQALELMKQARP